MKVKTSFPPCVLSAFVFLVLLSGQCCAREKDVLMTQTELGGSSTGPTHFFEAAESSVALDVTQPTTATFTSDIEKASDAATRTWQRGSFPVYLLDAGVETRNESSSHCEKARLCSLNDSRRPDRCSCHSHCHLFGDCCEDALQSNSSRIAGHLPRTAYSCYSCNSPFVKAVNIITSCPKNYEFEAVVKACNRSWILLEHDPRHETLSTPVTDGSTGLTYGNLFCAICWDANPQTSEPWLWNFQCNNQNIDTDAKKTIEDSVMSNPRNYSADLNGISTLTFLRTTCKSSFVPPRGFSAPFTECHPTEVSTCPSSFDPSHELVTLCNGAPFRRVYYNQVAYKNVYCLTCNHVADQKLPWSCLPSPDTASLKWNHSILLTPSRESCDINARYSQLTMNTNDFCSRLARCTDRDRQSIKCSGVCPSPMHNEISQCRPMNATRLCSFDEVPDESSFACSYWRLFAGDYLIVQVNSTAAMCYSCVFGSFGNDTMVNGSFAVAVNGSSRFYSNVITYVKEGFLNAFVIAPPTSTLSPMENDGTWCSSETLHWGVPLTTLLISQCCLVVYFVLYAVSPRLRCFVGEIVFNQSLGIFLGGTFFALRWITDYSPRECKPLQILLIYFYNAAFTWTSLLAIEVARAVSVVVSTTQMNRFNRRRVVYYVVGWGASLILVLASIVADELALYLHPSYGTWLCWYGNYVGMLVFAVGPLCVCLTIDLFAYIYVIVRLAVLERQTRMARETRREKLLLSVKLLLAVGLQWAFVVASAFASTDWLNCAFKVTGSLQGTFILLIFAIKRDVLAPLKCFTPLPGNETSRQSSASADAIVAMTELPAQAPVPEAS